MVYLFQIRGRGIKTVSAINIPVKPTTIHP